MLGIREIKISALLCFILLTALQVSCQKNEASILVKIAPLSNTLHEISGITTLENNKLYAINDSGNDNTLFCLNQDGKILKEIKIPDSKNIDWEDLTYDHNDNIYIGDFGNNQNTRKDLVIYKVSGILSNTISVSKIEFIFEDQKRFPPKKNDLNFDVEAFIHLNGNLYLFTKNRVKKSPITTKLYKISAKPGKYMAKLIGEYDTCKDPSDCLITAAAVNRSGNKIALLAHNKIFLLQNFKGDSLFNGSVKKIKLHHYSQKEGISFKNDSTLYITDEKMKHKKATLYQYTLD
ncbi:hypothetical protein D1816_01585 [Aquimarina sp. AD10]|uniref:hypothetical protein n=1 Tax=Aquimarina sp. AD10 TaxID=1714849 RepID=UPI000E508077|nr:hypothetical protein [Aquimarina sp. AD10]AXT59096.1 hypothetical protein D1816_01585 [Aquimarina sp. AD10]RKM91580.1 hypothetical protein D7033_22080 [Aquimarina sp. AD10]